MKMKRMFALLLAVILLSACIACFGDKPSAATPEPTAQAQADTPQPTDVPATPEPTEEPTPEPTEEPTPEPTPEPLKQGDLDEAFLALDNELFVDAVTSDYLSLHFYVRHPENFGINVDDVPVTLGNLTDETEDEEESEYVAWKEKLLAIDRDGLSDQLQFAYDTYLKYFDELLAAEGFEYQYEPLDCTVGIHLNLPMTFALYQFYDERDVQNYLKLLEDVPRYMEEILAYEQERANRGLFMTEDALDEVLDNLNSIVKSGNSSFLHATFKAAMANADYLTEEQKQDYIKQNTNLVKNVWVQGFKSLYDGLKALRPQCRESAGAYEQGGETYDYFCWKLKHEAGNNRTVDETVTFLGAVISDVYNEMYDSAIKSVDKWEEGRVMTTGSIGGDEAYLRTLMARIVPEMPEVDVEYVEVPKELQQGFSPAAYLKPAFDDFEHNIILTNPKNKANYTMSTLAHEGFPGHMFQATYQYAIGIPKFQMLIESNGYSEAWSTNSELNVAHINDRFGPDYATSYFLDDQLTTLIFTYCSLLVNGQGANKDKVRRYLTRWGMGDYTDYIYEYVVERPIYTAKYGIGFAELYDLTNHCREKLGDKFNIVEFHTEYLRWGPGKFEDLRNRMDAWINAQ